MEASASNGQSLVACSLLQKSKDAYSVQTALSRLEIPSIGFRGLTHGMDAVQSPCNHIQAHVNKHAQRCNIQYVQNTMLYNAINAINFLLPSYPLTHPT